MVWATVAAVILVGSRDLIFGDIPAVGSFLSWPGASGLAEIYGATWRDAGLGSSHPVPPAFGVLTTWTLAFLGDADLARTLLVVGALPLGAVGAYRLARPLASSPLPALAAMVAYATTPIPRNALAAGSLGPLVTYALAPFVVLWLLRGAGGLGEADTSRAWRPALAVGALTAVAGALWPAALLLPLLVALALVLAIPLVGGRPIALRTAAAAAGGTGVALVLLLPWSLLLPGADAASLGLLPRTPPGLGHVLTLRGGPAGAGVAPWGLLVAAALPLVVATGPRLSWAVRAWVLAALSWVVAWVPGRLDPEGSRLALDAVLVPAAVALSLAVGLGVAVLVADLRRVHFGWRQLTAVAAAAAVTLPVLGVLGDVRHGDWGLPARDWSGALAWMPQEAETGGFRVLWLGRPDLLPTGTRAVDGIGWGLSEDGTADVRELWPAPGDAGTAAVDDAVRLARAGRTARLGHLLAPMGVRYVALVERAAPASGARAVADPALRESLTRQLDLAVLQSEPGMDLYENQAWAATVAFAPPELAGPGPAGFESADAATRAELAATAPQPGDRGALELPGAGTLLLAERHDGRWQARLDGDDLEHRETFGWANGFVVPDQGEWTSGSPPARRERHS